MLSNPAYFSPRADRMKICRETCLTCRPCMDTGSRPAASGASGARDASATAALHVTLSRRRDEMSTSKDTPTAVSVVVMFQSGAARIASHKPNNCHFAQAGQ